MYSVCSFNNQKQKIVSNKIHLIIARLFLWGLPLHATICSCTTVPLRLFEPTTTRSPRNRGCWKRGESMEKLVCLLKEIIDLETETDLCFNNRYVGNLPTAMPDQLLYEIFATIAPVANWKIIKDKAVNSILSKPFFLEIQEKKSF